MVPIGPFRYNRIVTRAHHTGESPDEGSPVSAIGYIRVSTEGQAESGAGLEAQRAAIRGECERRGFELVHIYEDAGVSAKSLRGRPALQRALEVLSEHGASVLIVGKLDRLARSVADFGSLVRVAEKQRWAILACDLGIDMTTPTGGLLANVTASVAEWERRIIGQRTKEALATRKAAGVRLGRPTILAPAVAARIQSQRVAGATLRAIAETLNAEGIKTPTGRDWSPALVRKVSLRGLPEVAA
jgi:DNA invertase Pin-like site-specific DNA recombinase